MASQAPNAVTLWRVESSALRAATGLTGALVLGLLIVLRVLPVLRLVTLLLFMASACFMLVRRRGPRDLMHPVRVFGALWCFCLALASMRLLSYLSDWDLLTWSCFLTGLAGFVVAFWAAERISKRVAPRGADVRFPRLLPTRATLIVACLCLAVGIVVLAYEYYLLGEIPLLAENPDVSRFRLFGTGDPQFDKLYLKLLYPLVDFIKYGVFLAVIVLCQRTPKSKKVLLLSAALIVLGILALGSQGGRVFMVYLGIPSAVFFHYLRRRIRLVELAAVVLALFLCLGLFGYTRVATSQSAPTFELVRRISSFPEGQFWDGVAFGYGTLTLSYEVFYRLTGDLEHMQHPSGGFLFYSLHRFIPRASLGEVAGDLYSGEFVTATFLGDLYGDYRYWGVLFGPIVIGLAYGWVYSRTSNLKSVYSVFVRALLVQMVLFFPYVNLFSIYVNWIFDLIVMYLLLRSLSMKNAQASSPLPYAQGQVIRA
jgi:oligosaccharide repeat unit polymerase